MFDVKENIFFKKRKRKKIHRDLRNELIPSTVWDSCEDKCLYIGKKYHVII